MLTFLILVLICLGLGFVATALVWMCFWVFGVLEVPTAIRGLLGVLAPSQRVEAVTPYFVMGPELMQANVQEALYAQLLGAVETAAHVPRVLPTDSGSSDSKEPLEESLQFIHESVANQTYAATPN